MLATPAKSDVLAAFDAQREAVYVASPGDDELRPARGILLGMGLGLLSIGLLSALAWWLF
jgi:hypothetical protein